MVCMTQQSSSLTIDLVGAFLKKSAQVGFFVGVFYLGASYHQEFARWERNALYHHLKVEEGYFPDPEGLEFLVKINERGNIVPYLYHQSSGTSVPITNALMEQYGKNGNKSER